MAYIDMNTLSKEGIAVYCRVSTAGQNIQQQTSLAEAYFSKSNMDTTKVHYFLDNNVSANKLAMEKRPALNKLRLEIRKGKIRTVVVQNRDRLARNFYEYIDLVKEFYKYNIKVIFTDSSQAPFSKTLSTEALYGIFAQSEGRNIANRTGRAALQFPNSIYGFDVIGKRNEKLYVPNFEKRNVQALFKGVIECDSAEAIIKLIANYKKDFKGDLKLLACLKNPFYAGHLKMNEQYVQLSHVEPIISIEEYLQVQSCLLKFEKEIQASIEKANEKGLIQPNCCYCKMPMKSRSSSLEENAYYVCANKAHSRNSIEIAQYNQLITVHIEDVLNRIDANEIKSDVLRCLLAKEKQIKKERAYKDNQLKSLHREIRLNLENHHKRKFKSMVEQSKEIEEEIYGIDLSLSQIADARIALKSFVKAINERLINELQKYNQEYLLQLLFTKIEVGQGSIVYHTNFGSYIKGDEVANEY